MTNKCLTTLSLTALSFLIYSTASFAAIKPSFSASEHLSVASQVKLSFDDQTPGQLDVPLHLPNNLVLTYGEILPLGDLYGDSDNAISDGKNNLDRESRFLVAFYSLAQKPSSLEEAKNLVNVIHTEEKIIKEAIEKGQKPEDAYKDFGYETSRQFNCLTGGGCGESDWWLDPGRYLDLANNNYDHFGDSAWIAYSTGHHLAIREAASAHQSHDTKRLEVAYAMDAFASHFLSDRFSAGHIRVPRRELPDNVTPSLTGSLLAGYMHNEEDTYGLHVHNVRGDNWIAFGDRSFFNENNAANATLILEALQTSVDEVFNAYMTGSAATPDRVANLIPIANETRDAEHLDISPLFYWDEKTKKVLRREDMTNPFDRHWTDSWWGWSTLIELKRERGLAPEAAGALAKSVYRTKAIQDGLISQ